jgi:hypothetical protein
MMNVHPQPVETGPEVPEADSLEQHTSVLPDSAEELSALDQLPDEAPEADFVEQHTSVLPGSAGYAGSDSAGSAPTGERDAAEADLLEQAAAPSPEDEDEYPSALEDNG